jgi:hypothetical protein
LSTIAVVARLRARQLNLPLSTYITILLWNNHLAPARDLRAEPDSKTLIRVHVPCSIRKNVWNLVTSQIAASGLSANAFIEAVIARDLQRPQAPLIILPRR